MTFSGVQSERLPVTAHSDPSDVQVVTALELQISFFPERSIFMKVSWWWESGKMNRKGGFLAGKQN